MQIKVTLKGLSIPPLLSTAWDNILSLSMSGNDLQVKLTDGALINVPNLTPEQIDLIFEKHQKFLDTADAAPAPKKAFRLDIAPSDEGKLGFVAFDELGSMMQHDPSQADLEDLPAQVLEKISLLSQSLPMLGLDQLPQAVEGCNCMHCQITRALTSGFEQPAPEQFLIEEPISEKELQFSEWSIIETGDKLYTVINKLDPTEEYHVFLGNPIGCTCGNNKCEHILAVLKS